MNTRKTNGFILPSVLLIGLAMIIIGLSLIQTSSSVRSSIETIYYNKIASEAAEAGASYATYCLKSNDYTQTWGPDAGRPNLTQGTDCFGNPLAHPLDSLVDTDSVTSSFSVGDLDRGTDGSYMLSAVSKINLVSSSGTTIRSYTNTARKAVGADTIRFGVVTFGYFTSSSPIGSDGSFFAVRGSDGKYRVVGANQVGQLGNGRTANTLSPEIYNAPNESPAVSAYSNFVSQGYNLFILTADGSVYGAGLGDSGQLGNGKKLKVNSTPQLFQLPAGEKATFAAPKGDATYVVTESHNMYAAGSCTTGQLGINNSGCGSLAIPARVLLPTPNPADPNTIPTNNIVLDAQTAYVRMEGGRVYGWGNNAYGQLGNGTTNSSNVPIQVGSFGNAGQPSAVQITFDGDTIYVVDSDGNAWASGRNDYGETGLPRSTNRYTTFQRVPIPSGAGKVVQAVTDQWSVLFRTDSGQVWGAGLNAGGELGNGTTSAYTTSPVQFILPAGVKGTYVYNAGRGTGNIPFNNSFVIGSDGKVYGAGGNGFGQLGLGYNSTYVSTPAAMQVFDGVNLSAGDVITGLGTTIVLSTDKIYYTVGNNGYGQLGNGTTQNSNIPSAAEFLKANPAYIF